MLVIIPEFFTPIQKVCCQYIEKIIEDTSNNWYAADRVLDVELELYTDLFKEKSRYFEDYIQENLKTCSNEINGWVMWCDDSMSPSYFTHNEVKLRIDMLNNLRKK